jgi:hypothetical protein
VASLLELIDKELGERSGALDLRAERFKGKRVVDEKTGKKKLLIGPPGSAAKGHA